MTRLADKIEQESKERKEMTHFWGESDREIAKIDTKSLEAVLEYTKRVYHRVIGYTPVATIESTMIVFHNTLYWAEGTAELQLVAKLLEKGADKHNIPSITYEVRW